MLDQSELNWQLHELDRLLEAIEQLNLRNQTLLPNGITKRLQECVSDGGSPRCAGAEAPSGLNVGIFGGQGSQVKIGG